MGPVVSYLASDIGVGRKDGLKALYFSNIMWLLSPSVVSNSATPWTAACMETVTYYQVLYKEVVALT